MTEREKYLHAAVDAIGMFRITDGGLASFRQWWRDEGVHRRNAGLSQGDVDRLAKLARIRFKVLLSAGEVGTD